VTSLTFLIIGVPAALFRFARRRHERQQAEQLGVEYVDAWQGFTDAKLNCPVLSEMGVR
jgi:hypothetical protein